MPSLEARPCLPWQAVHAATRWAMVSGSCAGALAARAGDRHRTSKAGQQRRPIEGIRVDIRLAIYAVVVSYMKRADQATDLVVAALYKSRHLSGLHTHGVKIQVQ